MAIHVDTLLQPVSEELRCGPDLEYDLAFGELERAARGKEERRVGDEIKAAEEPRWPDVLDLAQALMERTRDLRIAVHLTQAALNVDGIAGLAAGLRVIQGFVETFWDSVHPQLDEEDGDDPTERINTLVALNDRDGLLRGLLRAPLVSSRVAGRFSLRDIRMAKGELAPVTGEQVPDMALVDAAFLDCDIDALTATSDAVKDAAAALDSIRTSMNAHVGEEQAPSFDGLAGELREMRSVLEAQLARRGIAVSPQKETGNGQDTGANAMTQAGIDEIRSREDVIRALDRVSEYFRKNEPSSPVPLLLQRAKRLVAKDFMEILRDLTPDAVSQAEAIGGLDRQE